MEDITLLEAVERYISGTMSPDDRVYFEGLRKSNPDIDQLVVEHTFFLQQLNRFDETRKLKNQLNEIHIDLAEDGSISSPRLEGRAKVVYLFHRYKRTAAIAAFFATVMVFSISLLQPAITKTKTATNKDIELLSGQIKDLKKENKVQNQEIRSLKTGITGTATDPAIIYKTGGTGFMIDAKGYLVTKAHVISGAKHIAVQNSSGRDLPVTLVFLDEARDLAILKIKEPGFRSAPIPYSIRRKSAEIAEPIFTMGYPRNDIVYGEGYLAARTGFNGDTLTCQIAIAANPGNSGGPILNRSGEVIGVLGARQTSAEGVVFATQSKYIFEVINQMEAADTGKVHVKLPSANTLKGLDRQQQAARIRDFIYMVKVD